MMGAIQSVKQAARPIRRKLTPGAFKEHYLNSALRGRASSTYLEIGVRWGESLRAVHAERKIGIDPVRHPAVAYPLPGEEFHECPSDVFFRDVAPSVLEVGSVHAALIDGLHEYGQALRDLLNLEPYMAKGGLVVLDDCNPRSEEMAVDTPTGGAWNGDVWRVMMLVRRECPDLGSLTLDRDQGVGLIWGFKDRSEPRRLDSDVLDRYKAVPFSVLQADRRSTIGLTRSGLGGLRKLGVPV